MLTTVLTVLLTLLRTVHGQTTTANHPRRAVAIRSGRATKGDEANAVETLFADRHHLLTVVEVKAGPQNRSGKKRPKKATNLPRYDAFCHWQLPPFATFCR